jgi:hypothetical protein
MASSNPVLTLFPRAHPECAAQRVGEEIVVLTPGDSKLHTLDGVGGRIFELSDGSRPVSEIALRLVEEYEVDLETAEADAATFVASLVDRKVLVLSEKPA